tara:strand:+ start:1296 stop:1478 length:183 start_codon:yes stop_codon:yes gene_type:complete
MRDELIEFLMSDAYEACAGDKDQMALYLAGVAVGILDATQGSVSRGYVRRNLEGPLVPDD